MCDLQIRNHFQTDTSDQVDDVVDKFQLLRGIPSVSFNFRACQ